MGNREFFRSDCDGNAMNRLVACLVFSVLLFGCGSEASGGGGSPTVSVVESSFDGKKCLSIDRDDISRADYCGVVGTDSLEIIGLRKGTERKSAILVGVINRPGSEVVGRVSTGAEVKAVVQSNGSFVLEAVRGEFEELFIGPDGNRLRCIPQISLSPCDKAAG